MKKMIISAFLLATVVAGSLLWNAHVHGHSSKMLAAAEQAMQQIFDHEKDAALKALEQLQQMWEVESVHWRMMVDHEKLSKIEGAVVRGEHHLRMDDYKSAYAELAAFVHELEFLIDRNRLMWENIF